MSQKKRAVTSKATLGDPSPGIQERVKHWMTKAWPFIVGPLLVALAIVVFDTRFETNDDPAMMFSANGYYTGTPDEHLIFSNVLIGLLLKGLYSVAPGINWYCLLLYAAHGLGLAGILYSLFRLGTGNIAAAGFILWFVMFRLRWILLLQFTTSSFAAGIGGIAILLSSLLKPSCPRPALYFATALITLCFLIRWEAGVPLVLLSLAFVLPVLIKGRFRQRREIYFAAAAILLGLLGRGVDRAYYMADPEWKAFLVSNDSLTTLIDGPWRSRRGEPEYHASVGWTRNDADVFVAWIFTDDSVFSIDRMRQLAEKVPFYGSHAYAGNIVKNVAADSIPQIAGTAALVFLTLLFTPWWTSVSVLSSLGAAMALLYFLAYHLKLETRVVHPMLGLVVLACVSFLVVQRENNKRVMQIRAGILWLAALGTILWTAPILIKRSMSNAVDNEIIVKECEQNYRIDPETVFIACGPGIHVEYMSPLKHTKLFEGVKIIPTASFIHSPIERLAHERCGIKNLYSDIVDNPRFVMVMDPKLIPRLITYYKEHYNRTVEFVRPRNMPYYKLFVVRSVK